MSIKTAHRVAAADAYWSRQSIHTLREALQEVAANTHDEHQEAVLKEAAFRLASMHQQLKELNANVETPKVAEGSVAGGKEPEGD